MLPANDRYRIKMFLENHLDRLQNLRTSVQKAMNEIAFSVALQAITSQFFGSEIGSLMASVLPKVLLKVSFTVSLRYVKTAFMKDLK